MTLQEVYVAEGADEEDVPRLAGALEYTSEHPVARRSPRAPRSGSGRCLRSSTSRTFPGGAYADAWRAVGRLFDHVPEELAAARSRAEQEGCTAVVAGCGGVARGVLAVAGAVKETSAEAVREPRALGLTPALLTGDNRTRRPRPWRGPWASRRSSPRCRPRTRRMGGGEYAATCGWPWTPSGRRGGRRPRSSATGVGLRLPRGRAFSSVFVVISSPRLRTLRPRKLLRGSGSRSKSPPGVRRTPHISSSHGSRIFLTLESDRGIGALAHLTDICKRRRSQ
ncbi:hypothetical protein [Streptomyces sp. NPDC051636]|uniref:hypothetical protein n=1 Tax=Streptomyces sp. NPDC051636 TaxID=3365663 RepID=UPI00378F5F05